MSESALQLLRLIRNNKGLKGRVTQTMDCGLRSQQRQEMNKLFQSPGYNCLESRYTKTSEEVWREKGVDISVEHGELLNIYGKKDALRLLRSRELEDSSSTSYCGTVPKIWSRFSQKQIMRTEAVVGDVGADEGGNEKEEILDFFGNSILVDIYYIVLDYRPCSGEDYVLGRSIMQGARLDG